MRVYVAGSSSQLDRVKAVMATLRERGYSITHDWVTEVETVGSANPPDATLADRRRWARADLKGVFDADILLLLMPATEGWGAGVELGFALGAGCPVVVSGASHLRSIFTSLAACYDRDDQALDAEFPPLTENPEAECDCRACEKFRAEVN